MKAARIPEGLATAMDEQSVERAIEMLEQMVASCARMVASLSHASAMLADSRSTHGFPNPNFD